MRGSESKMQMLLSRGCGPFRGSSPSREVLLLMRDAVFHHFQPNQFVRRIQVHIFGTTSDHIRMANSPFRAAEATTYRGGPMPADPSGRNGPTGA